MDVTRYRSFAPVIALAIILVPVGQGVAQSTYPGTASVHYAKSEVEKASGKCKATVIGGAILGAALGGLLGGRRGVAFGALGGTVAGATVCGVIMANARHRDQIIRAQIAAAASRDGNYTGSWTDDSGKPVIFTAQAGGVRQIDGSKLTPVKYTDSDGTERASPVLDTGGRDCRAVGGSFAGASGSAPQQLYCRTVAGDYEPYEATKT